MSASADSTAPQGSSSEPIAQDTNNLPPESDSKPSPSPSPPRPSASPKHRAKDANKATASAAAEPDPLHSSWQYAAFTIFCESFLPRLTNFQTYLDPVLAHDGLICLSQEDACRRFEGALTRAHQNRSIEHIQRLHITLLHILAPPGSKQQLDKNWCKVLGKTLTARWDEMLLPKQHRDLLTGLEELSQYQDVPLSLKVSVLHWLCMLVFDDPSRSEWRDEIKGDAKDGPPRFYPLGPDRNGYLYWTFDHTAAQEAHFHVYRESAPHIVKGTPLTARVAFERDYEWVKLACTVSELESLSVELQAQRDPVTAELAESLTGAVARINKAQRQRESAARAILRLTGGLDMSLLSDDIGRGRRARKPVKYFDEGDEKEFGERTGSRRKRGAAQERESDPEAEVEEPSEGEEAPAAKRPAHSRATRSARRAHADGEDVWQELPEELTHSEETKAGGPMDPAPAGGEAGESVDAAAKDVDMSASLPTTAIQS